MSTQFDKQQSRLASFFAGLWAILRQRCPLCRQGKIFRGSFAMNDPCPVCGLRFERDPGYFLGAMYASYFLASGVMVPLFFLIWWLWPELDSVDVVLVTGLAFLPFVPLVFRYSRVIWIHLDRWAWPGELSPSGPGRAEDSDRQAQTR